MKHPTTVPELTKRHGTSLRLTPAGEAWLAQRMAELCAQGTPGPTLTAKLNQEMGLNWTLQAYFQRARRLGLSWIAAERKGRRLTPAESLPEGQRPACYEDPACWEARNGWVDRLVCRECFNIFRDGAMDGKYGHLWTIEKMTRQQYRLRNPGALLFTFERIAKQSGCDVQKSVSQRLEEYATPQERAAHDADPQYEAHNKIDDYVMCRMPRCGFKSTAELRKHLRNVHDISGREAVEAYRREHGWPALYPQRVLRLMSTRTSERWAKLKAQAKAAQRRPPHRTADPSKQELFNKAAKLYPALGSWGRVARKLTPDEYSEDPKGAADRLRLGAKYREQQP